MKIFLQIIFLLPVSIAYSQEKNIIIKFDPPALTDFISGQSVVGGIEIPMANHFSLYSEFGVRIAQSYIDARDSSLIPSTGFRIKSELRYYLKDKKVQPLLTPYVAVNIFYIQDHHTSEIDYTLGSGTTTYTDAFGVKKNVFGTNTLIGLQERFWKRFVFDIYGGLGLRFRHISSVGKQYNSKTDDYNGATDVNIPDIVLKQESKDGFIVLPNLTLGIRLGYAF